jgi:hypothetical protein
VCAGTLDDLLKEEGTYEEAKAQVAKEMMAWQIQQAIKKKGLIKSGWPS